MGRLLGAPPVLSAAATTLPLSQRPPPPAPSIPPSLPSPARSHPSRSRVRKLMPTRASHHPPRAPRNTLHARLAPPAASHASLLSDVYNFADLNLLHTLETVSNPKGLCALCADSRSTVLACPGLQKGHLRVELFDLPKSTLIAAHESALSCLALNQSGTRLATASERGTLVRVWDTRTGQRLAELRRGAESAEIQSLSFNLDSTCLLVSSDHGTVHIFKLVADGSPTEAEAEAAAAAAAAAAASPTAAAAAENGNARSSFSFLQRLLPTALTPTYIQSQWSFAQFRLPGSDKQLTRAISAFGGSERSTFLVVCADGTFFKCRFDPVRGGECTREDWQRFLAEEDEV